MPEQFVKLTETTPPPPPQIKGLAPPLEVAKLFWNSCKIKLGYKVTDRTEYVVLLHTSVQTEEYNVMANSEKLNGTKEHLTLLMSGHINQCHLVWLYTIPDLERCCGHNQNTQRIKCRIISKQKMQHTYYITVLPYSTVPTPKYFFVSMPSVRDANWTWTESGCWHVTACAKVAQNWPITG